MKPLRQLDSATLVLPDSNIDTDQIIPARFLTTIERDGLGRHAFADWRFDDAGETEPDCILNKPEAASAEILVAGDNFGCGSSREHAVWALADFGFRAVISNRLADIFRANALKNGLLAIEVDPDTHAWLLEHPGAQVRIDIETCRLHAEGGPETTFELEPFARTCMLDGVDALGFLLARDAEIEAWEQHRPPRETA